MPHSDFFSYCEELLEKYRDTEQVGFISGRNNLYGDRVSDDSYFFRLLIMCGDGLLGEERGSYISLI